jgi:hypothetical protein
MARSDSGKKRTSYNLKVDNTGKTHKENLLLKSFWSQHKIEDIINLTVKELDAKIATWIENFEAVQKKRDRFWSWPTYLYDPNPVKKKKGKVNTKFNSSFVQKKMID